MQLPQAESSLVHVRQSLACYQEELLLDVLNRLVKPRLLPQRSELIERILATLRNPPVVDRRIRDLPENSRVLLTWIGLSYRPTWKVGHLVTASACLGHADGLLPILQLLEACLLYTSPSPRDS